MIRRRGCRSASAGVAPATLRVVRHLGLARAAPSWVPPSSEFAFKNERRRWLLTPAPSAAWDPSVQKQPRNPLTAAEMITITLMLPEDAELTVRAQVGSTLLEALEAADLSDVWDTRGACGGACQCSTCRIVVVSAPSPLPPRSEDEEDMLDTAVMAASRQPDADAEAAVAYLDENSRLACQLSLRRDDAGLVVTLPDDVLNILEVPLWLRGNR